MKIAILQLNFIIGDVAGNAKKIIEGYLQTVRCGVKLVVCTELALLGYPPKDLLLDWSLFELQEKYLLEIAKHVGEMPLILGTATQNWNPGKPLLNSAVVIRYGECNIRRNKRLLPNYGIFDEKLYFEPGSEDISPVIPMELEPGKIFNLAIFICEEVWARFEMAGNNRLYPNDPLDLLADNPYDLIVSINASPYLRGKGDVRFDLLSGIARKYNRPVIYANQVGGNDDIIFDGRSTVFNANGMCIGAAPPFEEALLIVDLDNAVATNYPHDTDNIPDIHQALVLGTRDYVRKTGHKKGVIGLSGGIDSAVVAAIAAEALGPENVLGVAMPSPYSAKESYNYAIQLVMNLKTNFLTMPIGEAYAAYRNILEPVTGWNDPGTIPGNVATENVQARIRGNFLMYIANMFPGTIVLSTGNKSEMSVGYCTLYGDMAGGLSVIGDLLKTRVYELARYINREREIIPAGILTRPPSAELAPGQADSDSLPPYDVLDKILYEIIECGMSPEQVMKDYPDLKETVTQVVARLNRAEHKRRQMPPCLKITRNSLGIGRRMPIAAKFLI